MTRIDDGHKAIAGLARTYGQLDLASANEAETRFKVIDDVLLKVLGQLTKNKLPMIRLKS